MLIFDQKILEVANRFLKLDIFSILIVFNSLFVTDIGGSVRFW